MAIIDSTPRALVVDDDPGMRELLSESLTQFGFGCTEAASGEEALDWLAWENFDLIVLDIRMADTNGFEVLQQTRNEHLGTAVLMVSGLTSPEAFSKSKTLGADAFLMKPFTLSQLGAAIRSAYDERDRGPADQPREDLDQPLPGQRYRFTVGGGTVRPTVLASTPYSTTTRSSIWAAPARARRLCSPAYADTAAVISMS